MVHYDERMLDGGKEVDLLAFDPHSGEKYHIEVRVATGRGFRIKLLDTQTHDGRKHKRGMDTLNEIKFSPPQVVNACSELFGCDEYKKVLVVWDVQKPDVIEQTKKLYGIEIWRISNMITELLNAEGTKAYRDDILRTVPVDFIGDAEQIVAPTKAFQFSGGIEKEAFRDLTSF